MKKVLLNILFCLLFVFLGGIILGIIIEDNSLAFTICFKIVLGYFVLLSLIYFVKSVKETIKNIKKQKVKKTKTPITWGITILPYVSLWGLLIALIFNQILSIGLTIAFIALALYLTLVLVVGIWFNSKLETSEVDNIEKEFKNKK